MAFNNENLISSKVEKIKLVFLSSYLISNEVFIRLSFLLLP